jgi:hypothetical protein
MPRLLTQLKVNEISVCRKGAGEGCRVTILKRHDDDTGKYFDGYPITKGRRPPPSFKSTGAAKAWLFDEGAHFRVRHRDTDIETLARHLVDASINKQHEVPMTREELTKSIARYGVDALISAVIKAGPFISEEELVKACGSAQTFAKLYEGTSPRSRRLQKAIDICKGNRYSTTTVAEGTLRDPDVDMQDADDGLPEFSDDVDYTEMENVRGGRNALAQGGQQMTDEAESDGPSHRFDEADDECEKRLSPGQRFNKLAAARAAKTGEDFAVAYSKCFLDPANRSLAEAERRQARRQMGMPGY